MKSSLLILFILMITSSCERKKVSIQNDDINANNIVDKIFKEVIHFSSEPIYQLEFTINHCSTEILVNDIPVFKFYGEEGQTGTETINFAIVQKGLQTATIRMYAQDGETPFINNSGVKIEIGSYDNKIKYTDKGKMLFSGATKSDKNGIFVASGKFYYEETFTFELKDVPYKNKGWSDNQNLSAMNLPLLKEKVVKKYTDLQHAIKTKDLDAVAQFSYHRLRDQFVSEYATRQEIQDAWDEIVEVVQQETQLESPKNYELRFYGNGKLVGLQTIDRNKEVRGMGPLYMKAKQNGKNIGVEFLNLLHLPNNKSNFEVY